ncbi:MAG: hypothetical protein QOE11_1539, partial [Solirubrobacteraceae bacterium]|nr:hypothetical protein [Solirubrobacteraceae bacterium]
LPKTFRDARIVQVAATARPAGVTAKKPRKPAAKKSSAPGAGSAFDQSKKQPKTLGTGGKPPPKDNTPAAGGGGFQDIG